MQGYKTMTNTAQQIANIEASIEVSNIADNDLLGLTVVDHDGDGFNQIEIMNYALEVQKGIDTATGAKNNLAEVMVLMAGECHSFEAYNKLTSYYEDKLHWGTSKSVMAKLSDAEKARQVAIPKTYGQYKSKINAAMKQGVIPMTDFTFTGTDKDGNPVQKHEKLDSVKKLVKARQQVEASASLETEEGQRENETAILLNVISRTLKIVPDTMATKEIDKLRVIAERLIKAADKIQEQIEVAEKERATAAA